MKSQASRRFRPGRALMVALLLGVLPAAAPQAQTPLKLPVIELQVDGHTVQAEVASTEAQRSQGLMHRTHLAPERGMLFVFSSAGLYCFWMKNTLIPLSIAFIDEEGRIVQQADMQPQDLRSHCPDKPVRYALEMNQGWFRDRKIGQQAIIEGLPATRVTGR